MHAYVISLASRPDRLTAFMEETHIPVVFAVRPFQAVNGVDALIGADVRARITKRENIPPRKLPGIVGCCLSHVGVWERIAAQSEPMAVFEDDARPKHGDESLRMALRAMDRLPKDADLVWMNDYNVWNRQSLRSRLRGRLTKVLGGPERALFRPMPYVLTTTEAYVITPRFAARLADAMRDDIGAADEQMRHYSELWNARVYQTDPPLFTQADRNDSTTGSERAVPAEPR